MLAAQDDLPQWATRETWQLWQWDERNEDIQNQKLGVAAAQIRFPFKDSHCSQMNAQPLCMQTVILLYLWETSYSKMTGFMWGASAMI